MIEPSVEYGIPPEGRQEQKKVQKLFIGTWTKLNTISNNTPQDKENIESEIQHLMDELSYLHIELPCQGVEYQGVIVDRDSEIPEGTSPAPFIEWGKALGVSSDLFENKK